MELERVLNALVEKIRRDYPGDISLVHVHGSYAYGDTHPLSDLDLYFVAKTERGNNLACTFILNGIGYDFWAIPWQRLEGIAAHRESTASIITQGRLVYTAGEEDARRFEALRQQALQGMRGSDPAEAAIEKLLPAYRVLHRMRHCGTLAGVRREAIGVVYALSFALAQLNRSPIERGRRLLKQEILAMPLAPRDFAPLYDAIFTGRTREDITDACDRLVENTRALVEAQRDAGRPPAPFRELFAGFYEEMIQSYNKIYRACQTGDMYTPLFATAEFEAEIDALFHRAGVVPDLPDMAAAYDPEDLTKIEACAREHQRQFEALLAQHHVPVRRFESYDAFQAFLDAL